MFSGRLVGIAVRLTHHDQDIKTTSSIIANGRSYEATPIPGAIVHYFFSSRFHLQGLLEIRCSRVKLQRSVSALSHGYPITFPRPCLSCVLRWSEGPLAFVLLSCVEVNGTDLCRHIPVPIIIRFRFAMSLLWILIIACHSLVYSLHRCHSSYVSPFMHHHLVDY